MLHPSWQRQDNLPLDSVIQGISDKRFFFVFISFQQRLLGQREFLVHLNHSSGWKKSWNISQHIFSSLLHSQFTAPFSLPPTFERFLSAVYFSIFVSFNVKENRCVDGISCADLCICPVFYFSLHFRAKKMPFIL